MQKQAAFLLVFIATLGLARAQDNSPVTTAPAAALAAADSLFAARQYTQALDGYLALHRQGTWSQAMFLKMAYIEEALGRLGESLYYLNLYTLASHDPEAMTKMEEMAEKNHLEGYGEEAFNPITGALRQYYVQAAGLLLAFALLLAALQFNRVRQQKSPSLALAVVLVMLLAMLFLHANYSRNSDRAIVTHAGTYLMSGPSSAASVVEIIGEGHQVRVLGKQDVWLRVNWKDGEAYVREFLVRKVEL